MEETASVQEDECEGLEEKAWCELEKREEREGYQRAGKRPSERTPTPSSLPGRLEQNSTTKRSGHSD